MRAAKLNDSQTGGIFGVLDAQAKELAGNAAAVSPDGRTLVIAGKSGVLWVDTSTLKTRDTQLAGWSVWSLAMSPDGTTLYVVDYAGMIAEVPMAGAHSATTFAGAGEQPLALMRVAPA
jgi:sugar lactone lactonase YvrE